MSVMTEEEWARVQATLVRGGLRQEIDRILIHRVNEVRGNLPSFTISDANRSLIFRAYDDGDGGNVTLKGAETEGWFIGVYDTGGPDECEVMEGAQIDGVLYCICPQSGGGLVSVVVGEELIENVVGPTFHTQAEARAYIQGRTTK